MRLSIIFLMVTVTSLLGNGNALSDVAAANQDTGISTMISPELVRSVEATGTEKRFLRSHQVMEYGGDDDDDQDSEEERAKGANLFATSKLDQMESSIDTFKRFKNWKAYGLSPGDVATRLENKGIYQKYKDLYFMYQRHYTTI
ncbi:Secreted RxLR effector peptide protein [Phytophthora palmivora]|uniref:RxLR effector protein n=1 Tax=Phytophthora palmivora TaxID=4796 RepID=A0A2P4YHR5_9STRA|nr:Secreted RxLR effector peptide protein [Phytophthora palmivora]